MTLVEWILDHAIAQADVADFSPQRPGLNPRKFMWHLKWTVSQ
jgi:hypothetical protein